MYHKWLKRIIILQEGINPSKITIIELLETFLKKVIKFFILNNRIHFAILNKVVKGKLNSQLHFNWNDRINNDI